ncbi:lytic transglycosylase domain-containing protein [Streptosporangium sp. NPDC051022]|uniref:lytic transglycosylase domain-containing protein n=1 Tax=Streptosporangium sp. NPDC051022 TaxID=3155752 RepID=UPI00341D04C2
MSHHPRLGVFVAVLAVIALAVAGGAVFLVLRPADPPAFAAADSGPSGSSGTNVAVGDLAKLAPWTGPARPSPQPSVPSPATSATPGTRGTTTGGPGITLTPPRLFVISQSTLPERTKNDISRLKHVQKIDSFDGGAVKVSGVGLNLLAVDPARFRAWAPRAVAGHQGVWDALSRGELVADSSAVRRLGLVLGSQYQVDGGPRLRVAASAPFGLPGVDGLVGTETGRRLGLLPGVALLVNGPRKATSALNAGVRGLLGSGAQVLTVGGSRTAGTTGRTGTGTDTGTGAGAGTGSGTGTGTAASAEGVPRPAGRATVGRPGSYLELYRRAAAVCPGLSWTVLAAIGQVESSHGRNNGPSSAGALGPMQFMPATWKVYGVDGDGDGVSDIWNPYDAVPGAANYLCANGAGQGGAKLEKAVWFYNHSWAYVGKVMSIAQAYARTYP